MPLEAALYHLQRLVGNSAVSELVRGMRDGPVDHSVVQLCSAERCSESCGKAQAWGDLQLTEAGMSVQRQGGGGVVGGVLGASCTPYASKPEAEAAYRWVRSTWLPYALGVFGPQTEALWSHYLSRTLGLPRPLETFATPGTEIVEGFRSHHKTREAEIGLLDEAAAKLRSSPRLLPADTPVTIPLADLVAPGTVWSLLNAGGRLAMRFDLPDSTIAGNIAGGVGSGPDPDTRNAWGDIVVTNVTDGAGHTVDVELTSALTFAVHDTVDFCPGVAIGGPRAQPVTIPMSRLEATGTTFGPPYAGDVPFNVLMPGPHQSKRYGTTIPTSPLPPVPAPGHIQFRKNEPRPGHGLDLALTPAGKGALPALVAQLAGDPSLHVQIIGRASSEGRAEYNQALSERRALAVLEYLLSNGIDPARISDRATTTPSGDICQSVAPGVVACRAAPGATVNPTDREVVAETFRP